MSGGDGEVGVIRVNNGDLSLCGRFTPDKARTCTLDARHDGPHEWEATDA